MLVFLHMLNNLGIGLIFQYGNKAYINILSKKALVRFVHFFHYLSSISEQSLQNIEFKTRTFITLIHPFTPTDL